MLSGWRRCCLVRPIAAEKNENSAHESERPLQRLVGSVGPCTTRLDPGECGFKAWVAGWSYPRMLRPVDARAKRQTLGY